ncbi:aldehyde dehydrogenase family protein [Nocardia sp. NPDC049707]|uniref:aldehyde dehydrogenase family protein n=1 Tax=Nocardia sp. NPDC049707 TaxID=3154735 RepID=UPI00343B0385
MPYSFDKLFIDGRWVDSRGDSSADAARDSAGTADGGALEVLNPATGLTFATAPMGTRADAAAAVLAARRAFDEGPWGRTTPRDRAAYLLRLAEAIEARRERLTDLVVREGGFPIAFADRVHLQTSIDTLRDVAERVLPGFAFQQPLNPHFGMAMTGATQATQGIVAREPIGVASLIVPFNAPFALAVHKLAWALAAGCTTVVKPSPYTPLQVLTLGELIDEAGFPPGVVNIVTGKDDVAIELTTHSAVDIVSFTGSDIVGRKVMAQASGTLKKTVLELGGKSAGIVFADADLDLAAVEVVGNMIGNCGQGCLLLTRTLVEDRVHDELVDKVLTLLPSVAIGDPADPSSTLGPLIRDTERLRVEHMIRQGEAEGAKIAWGGRRPAGLDQGFFLEPTLFVEVDNTMSVARKEFFGPVGAIIPFHGADEAVSLANDSDFGLNAGVFTADFGRALAVARRIRSGNVNINSSFGFNPDAPFGGYKQSGLGREGGSYGIAEFLEEKFISWPVG